VTIEAAIGVAALVGVLLLVLAGMAAVLVQVRCVDAAGEAARLAARDDVAGARRTAALLPGDAEVAVEVRDEVVVVRVRAPPLGSALPGLRVGAEATAAREGGVAAVAAPEAGDPP
jgi:uncharacterized iron-regulated membrane protein